MNEVPDTMLEDLCARLREVGNAALEQVKAVEERLHVCGPPKASVSKNGVTLGWTRCEKAMRISVVRGSEVIPWCEADIDTKLTTFPLLPVLLKELERVVKCLLVKGGKP